MLLNRLVIIFKKCLNFYEYIEIKMVGGRRIKIGTGN